MEACNAMQQKKKATHEASCFVLFCAGGGESSARCPADEGLDLTAGGSCLSGGRWSCCTKLHTTATCVCTVLLYEVGTTKEEIGTIYLMIATAIMSLTTQQAI